MAGVQELLSSAAALVGQVRRFRQDLASHIGDVPPADTLSLFGMLKGVENALHHADEDVQDALKALEKTLYPPPSHLPSSAAHAQPNAHQHPAPLREIEEGDSYMPTDAWSPPAPAAAAPPARCPCGREVVQESAHSSILMCSGCRSLPRFCTCAAESRSPTPPAGPQAPGEGGEP